jgi:hypothetical protein
MPRNVNPGTIQVGKGLAPEGTVEDNSLRYPERDVDPLRVHIHDPSRAHMAETIGIKDEGDCYTSDDVEGALQEICAGSGAGRLNGLISGGTFDELGNEPNGSSLTALAPLTLESPTEVSLGAGVLDASGLQITLPNAAVTYFIYIDCDAASPTYRTLQYTTGAPPEVESGAGVEHVMIARVDVNGANQIVGWQDARFFVRNLDRKVQYSSRKGENVDAWSEGCFATLQSFFFWMQYYGDTGTSEEEKGTVLIRGTHDLGSFTLTVPTDHLQFIGDGEAVITGGNIAAPLIDVSSRTDILFRGITFSRSATETVAITGSGGMSRIKIENCTFSGAFPQSIFLTGATSVMVQGCTMNGCVIGVRVDDSALVQVVDNQFSAMTSAAIYMQGACVDYTLRGNVIDCGLIGGAGPTAVGINITGDAGGVPARGIVSGNVVRRCYDGILAQGFDSTNLLDTLVIVDNVISEIAHDIAGLRTDTFGGVGTKGIGLNLCRAVNVSGNLLDSIGAIAGVGFANPVYTLSVYGRNCQQIIVSNNQIRDPQSDGGGNAAGIVFSTGKLGVGFVSARIKVVGNVLSFGDTNNSSEYGILFVASDGTDVPVFNEVEVSRNDLKAGVTVAQSVTYGIFFTTADLVAPSNLTGGTFSDVRVSENHIENHRAYGVGFYCENSGPTEAHDNTLENLTVVGNNLNGATPNGTPVGIWLAAESTNVAYKSLINGYTVQQNVIRGYGYGIWATVTDNDAAQPSVCRDVSVTGNQIYNLSDGGVASKVVGINFGVVGVGVNDLLNVNISSNVIRGEETPSGIVVTASNQGFTDLRVDGNTCDLGDGVSTPDAGIQLAAGDNTAAYDLRNVSFSGNQIRLQNTDTGGFALGWFFSRINIYEARISDNILIAGGRDALKLSHSGDDGVFEGLSVEDNTIEGFSGGEGLLLELSSTALDLQQVSLNRNQFIGVHDFTDTSKASLRLVATQTSTSTFKSIQVEGNQINKGATGNYPRRGISMNFPTQTGVAFTWENISVSDNDVQIEFVDAGLSIGIDLLFQQIQSTPSFVENLRVEQNTVQIQASGVLSPTAARGIEVEATCNVRGLSLSSNQVDCGNSVSYFDHGIRLFHAFTTAEAVVEATEPNNYVVGTSTGVIPNPDMIFDGDPFNAVSWEAVSVCDNQIRISAGQDTLLPTTDPQRGALSIQHVRVPPGSDYVAVCLWGFVCSGNVLRSPKANAATGSGNALEMFGFRINIMQVRAQWPNGVLSTDSRWVQEGWAITGNSSTDFARRNGGAGAYNGRCVLLALTAGGVQSGINTANAAQDNGTGNGWDEFALAAGGVNSNNNPRNY